MGQRQAKTKSDDQHPAPPRPKATKSAGNSPAAAGCGPVHAHMSQLTRIAEPDAKRKVPPLAPHTSHTRRRELRLMAVPHNNPILRQIKLFYRAILTPFLSVPRSCGTRGILRSRWTKSWSHATCSAPSSPASAVSPRCRSLPEQDDSMAPDHQPDPCSLDPG